MYTPRGNRLGYFNGLSEGLSQAIHLEAGLWCAWSLIGSWVPTLYGTGIRYERNIIIIITLSETCGIPE